MSRVIVEKDLRVSARDGVGLATDVYRQDVREPVPAIVQRLPYDKESWALRNLSLDVMRAVGAGYAVVVQDTRGRYASGGSFEPFRSEGADGADTIEWVAARPWCSGAVGMAGGSYVGATQWLAAMERPPALGALAPHVTAADYHGGWAYRGGAFELGFNLTWALGTLAIGEALRRVRAGLAEPQLLRDRIALADRTGDLLGRLPLNDFADLDDLVPHYREWLERPDPPATGQRVEHGKVSAPALNIGGWFDLFCEGTIANYSRARDHGGGPAARRPRLLIGPWSHAAQTGWFAERSFGLAGSADGADLTGEQLRWFDHHLRGSGDPGPPVRLFVIGPNVWRDEQDWPLPDTEFTPLYLRAGGGLSAAAPASEPPDTYRYDPLDPVPTVGGATFLPGLAIAANAGPRDQRTVEARADVLCYTTAALEHDTEVTGPVELELYVSSSALDTDFTAKLVDVHPDGRAELVVDGILRARYRDPTSGPLALRPGAIEDMVIAVGSTSWVFATGHRIRLEVSSSNFPRFDRNTNTGGAIAADSAADAIVATNSVHHDGRHPSRLVLPIIDRR